MECPDHFKSVAETGSSYSAEMATDAFSIARKVAGRPSTGGPVEE
jgi:hypothetical protein